MLRELLCLVLTRVDESMRSGSLLPATAFATLPKSLDSGPLQRLVPKFFL
jgi:hypothetical protein